MTPKQTELMSSETFGEITLERILARGNLMQALKKVEANKGSCGAEQILQGTFRKGPANRIWNVGMFTGTALVPNGMPGGVGEDG